MKTTLAAAFVFVVLGGVLVHLTPADRRSVPQALRDATWQGSGKRPVIPEHPARNRPGYGPFYEPVQPVLDSRGYVVDWELYRNGRPDAGPVRVSYGDVGDYPPFTPDWSHRKYATNYGLTVDYSVPPWAR